MKTRGQGSKLPALRCVMDEEGSKDEEFTNVIRSQRITISLILGLFGAAIGISHGVWSHKNAIRQAAARFNREAPAAALRTARDLDGLVVDLPTTANKRDQQRILTDLVRDDPRILFAALIDQFQQVSVEAELPAGASLDVSESKPLSVSLQDILRDREPNSLPESGEYYQPIFISNDTLWGQLRLVWNQQPAHDIRNAVIRRTAIVSTAAFFLAALVAYLVFGRYVLGDLDRLTDTIERIASGTTRGRLEPSLLAVDMLPLVTQVNRLLEDHEEARKRIILLEDNLRQAESSYQDYKSRMSQVSESMEREKSMAMLAFYEIFENTGDGIIVCDHDGEVSGANRPARRWMGLRESQGDKINDRALLTLVQNLTSGGGENSECSWTYRDPIDGQGRQARVYAALLESRDAGQGVVLLHILPERSRKGASGPLERLYSRFIDEMVVPTLASVSRGENTAARTGGSPSGLDELVRWAQRLRRLSDLEASYAGGRSNVPGPERFDLGPWLAKQLQAPDLFADELAIRLYPPEVAALVAVPVSMVALALDGLVAFLHEARGRSRSRTAASEEFVEWVVRLQRDSQQRAELVITPTGDYKPSSITHLNVLRDATETVRPNPASYAERLTCRQEIALKCFLTAQIMIGSGMRVAPGDKKTPPVIYWVFPHPDRVNNRTAGGKRLHPKTGGVDSMIERFFGR